MLPNNYFSISGEKIYNLIKRRLYYKVNKAFLYFYIVECYRINALGAGLSPFAPNETPINPLPLRFKYHAPVDGLKIAASALPSPS
jgi:hypothetical protein